MQTLHKGKVQHCHEPPACNSKLQTGDIRPLQTQAVQINWQAPWLDSESESKQLIPVSSTPYYVISLCLSDDWSTSCTAMKL